MLRGQLIACVWPGLFLVSPRLPLGGTELARNRDGETAVWASRARTLVDAVYDWSRFPSLPRGFGWIRKELAARRVTARQLVETTLESGDKATICRIGWLLEQEGAPATIARRLLDALPTSSGLVPLNPMAPKRGRADRRWGVVSMTASENQEIRRYEDRELFATAIAFTVARTGFSQRLIEKDYFCTVIPKYLASVEGLVFAVGKAE